jgi:hypothetical protein
MTRPYAVPALAHSPGRREMEEDLIALFSFELVDSNVRVVSGRH